MWVIVCVNNAVCINDDFASHNISFYQEKKTRVNNILPDSHILLSYELLNQSLLKNYNQMKVHNKNPK